MGNARNAWIAVGLLFGVNLLNFFDRQLPGALGEPIRKEFELSDTALGLLGTVFTLIYAVVGLPFGRLADRWSRKRLISGGVALWSILTAAGGVAWSYPALFAARVGVGIGEATCAPASQSLIGDLFPAHQRSRALGIFMLGLPVGLFLAYVFSGIIGEKFGWRWAFVLACAPGLVLSALVLLIQEPPRQGSASKFSGASFTDLTPYRSVLRIPTMWWIAVSGALQNFNMYAVNAFQTPFLQRYHEMGLRDANNVSAIVLGAVGVIGLLAGGWASDRLSMWRTDGRLLLSSVTMLVAAPCILIALNQPQGDVVGFMIPMAIGVTFQFVYYATVYAAIQDVVPPHMRGTAVALYFFAMYVMGASLGTYGIGALSDFFAHRAMLEAGATEMAESFRATGLHNAMFVIPFLALLCGLVLFAASRTVEADVRRNQPAVNAV